MDARKDTSLSRLNAVMHSNGDTLAAACIRLQALRDQLYGATPSVVGEDRPAVDGILGDLFECAGNQERTLQTVLSLIGELEQAVGTSVAHAEIGSQGGATTF